MKTLTSIAMVALALCATTALVQPAAAQQSRSIDVSQIPRLSEMPTFDATSHFWYRDSHGGPYQLSGRAFLEGSNPATCEGTQVALLPDTPFFQEMIDVRLAGGGLGVPNDTHRVPLLSQRISDPVEVRDFVRLTSCTANGDFKFTNLPAGKWIVVSEVASVNPRRPHRVTRFEVLAKRVELGNQFKHGTLLQEDDILN